MSTILQPQQDFPIVRQIANHTDATVYYIEAVVRDADGVLLDRVQLVSQGEQRYQKRYRVPVDRTGAGSYISIITSVYTDAGYTTKSSNYGDEENTYLIFDRLTNRGGGGGSINLEQGDIRRIIREELDKQKEAEDAEEEDDVEEELPEPIEIPRYDSELRSINSMLQKLAAAVQQIPTDKVDTFPILEGIQNLANAIDDKEVTPETELEPVLNSMDELKIVFEKEMSEEKKKTDKFHQDIKKLIVEELAKVEFTQEMPVTLKRNKPEQTEEPAKQYDLRKFVS